MKYFIFILIFISHSVFAQCKKQTTKIEKLESFANLNLNYGCLGAYVANELKEYHPDRNINGEKLAENVAAWAQENTKKENWFTDIRDSFKSRMKAGATLLPRLWNGSLISYDQDQNDIQKLRKWLLSTKDLSVTPDQLIKHALAISEGNIERAITMCYNHFLVEGAVGVNAIERDTRWYVMKMTDITGEREVFDDIGHKVNGQYKKFGRGDLYSAYYHFFATALHSYIREESSVSLRLPTSTYSWLEESQWNKSMEDKLKRKQIDEEGAEFGKNLAELLKKDEKVKVNGKYIEDRPDLYGEKWALKEGQHPRDFNTDNKTYNYPTALEEVTILKKLMQNEKYYKKYFNCYADHLRGSDNQYIILSVVETLSQDRDLKTGKIKKDSYDLLKKMSQKGYSVVKKMAQCVLTEKTLEECEKANRPTNLE